MLSIYRTLKAPAVRSRRARVQAAYDIKDPSDGPRSRSQVKGIKAELSLALLVACAALLERLTDATIAWLPLYNQAKLILWIWLLVSRNLVKSPAMTLLMTRRRVVYVFRLCFSGRALLLGLFSSLHTAL